MFFINTVSYAVHSCASHHVPCRARNRFVVNRASALTSDEMVECNRRLVPLAGGVVHFSASFPRTGLARRPVPIRCLEIYNAELHHKHVQHRQKYIQSEYWRARLLRLDIPERLPFWRFSTSVFRQQQQLVCEQLRVGQLRLRWNDLCDVPESSQCRYMKVSRIRSGIPRQKNCLAHRRSSRSGMR